MIERSLQIDSNSNMHANESRCATRPTDLPTENRRWARHGKYCRTRPPTPPLFHSLSLSLTLPNKYSIQIYWMFVQLHRIYTEQTPVSSLM